MKTTIALATLVAVALLTPIAAAEKVDPRLATARKAHIVANDELGNDRAIAQCVAEHIAQTTPIESVATADGADLVLRVGATKRATMTAYLPDGTTKIWAGDNELKAGFGLVKVKMDPCVLADNLILKLRDAMRKARDGGK